MTKKHYISIAICALLMVISIASFSAYYRDFILPESYVIGTVNKSDYKELSIKDYLSDNEVLFSQNINDVTFSNNGTISVYEYMFDSKEFDGEKKDYIIYVNDYMISDLTENAGTIGGTHYLNYYDTEKQILCSSAIKIDFSFYSMSSKLRVSLNQSELGYLMNYFKTDNFIITIAENPYIMMNKDGESSVPSIDETQEINLVIFSTSMIRVKYNDDSQVYSGKKSVPIATYSVKSIDEVEIHFYTVGPELSVLTDGAYSIETVDSGVLLVKWQHSTYIQINVS